MKKGPKADRDQKIREQAAALQPQVAPDLRRGAQATQVEAPRATLRRKLVQEVRVAFTLVCCRGARGLGCKASGRC